MTCRHCADTRRFIEGEIPEESDELTNEEKQIISLELQNEACVDRIVWEQSQYYTLLEHYRDLLDDYNELKARLGIAHDTVEES